MVRTLIYYLAMKAQKSWLDIQDAVGSDGINENVHEGHQRADRKLNGRNDSHDSAKDNIPASGRA